jgi:hypothetical protein
MTSRNYFKTKSGQIFFFTQGVPESIEDAYVAAYLTTERISIYKAATVAGPWDALPIIGHRTRSEILRDMAAESDEDKLEVLADELDSFDECFYSIDRVVPLQAVA